MGTTRQVFVSGFVNNCEIPLEMYIQVITVFELGKDLLKIILVVVHTSLHQLKPCFIII